MQSELRTLVENFTNELSLVMRRVTLEEMQAKLALTLGEVVPARRGPGRPRMARPAATGKSAGTRRRGRPGKFSPEEMEKLGSTIVGHLKKNPGARSEHLSAAMKLDAKSLRIPLAALVKAKKIKVKGQKRGTQYFVR